MSLLGQVGTRLGITANYDTESTFDFQNQLKLEYTPSEDDIIQKIEVGNVNMPLNNTLIQGAQSLFGFKTQLQFGKTRITKWRRSIPDRLLIHSSVVSRKVSKCEFGTTRSGR